MCGGSISKQNIIMLEIFYRGMTSRRSVVGALGTTSVAALAGCVNFGGGGGGSSSTSSGSSSDFDSQEEDCRTVERTQEENLTDQLETVSAGSVWTFRYDLEEGDRLIINARMVEGARPAVTVENPSGATIADIGPAENIQRTITARETGRYFIQFVNEATLTSGQWDVQIDWERDYEEEVCN